MPLNALRQQQQSSFREFARKEIEPHGFVFKELHDFLPWQHIIIFEKPAQDQPADPKPPAGGAAQPEVK